MERRRGEGESEIKKGGKKEEEGEGEKKCASRAGEGNVETTPCRRERTRASEAEKKRERGRWSGAEEGKRVRAGTPRANHSRRSANNLLVFHIRFDSLSFRYLYLSDLLRISGISRRERAGNARRGGGARSRSRSRDRSIPIALSVVATWKRGGRSNRRGERRN